MENTFVVLIVLMLVVVGLGIFLAPNARYDKKDEVATKNDCREECKNRLTVGDGVRFGVGFGLSLFIWSVIVLFLFGTFIGSLFQSAV